MALTKQTIVDKCETVAYESHFILQVREAVQIVENDKVISQNFHRYILKPDHDVSTISDPLVSAQFNAVMTSKVKANYQDFLEEEERILSIKSE